MIITSARAPPSTAFAGSSAAATTTSTAPYSLLGAAGPDRGAAAPPSSPSPARRRACASGRWRSTRSPGRPGLDGRAGASCPAKSSACCARSRSDPERVFPRDELLRVVWGWSEATAPRPTPAPSTPMRRACDGSCQRARRARDQRLGHRLPAEVCRPPRPFTARSGSPRAGSSGVARTNSGSLGAVSPPDSEASRRASHFPPLLPLAPTGRRGGGSEVPLSPDSRATSAVFWPSRMGRRTPAVGRFEVFVGD